MSVNLGPRTNTSQLAVYCDMGNTSKSWIGAPTTNLFGEIIIVSAGATLIDQSINSFSLDSPTTGWVAHIDATLTAGTTYTLSFEYRTNFNGSALYFDNDGASDNSFNINLTASPVWQKATKTATASSSGTMLGWFSRGGSGSIYVRNIQIEIGSVSTPFVKGQRSNTASLLDLSGKSSTVMNNMNYNSDGSFDFQGTGQYFSYSGKELSSSTLEFVFYNPGGQTDAYPTLLSQVAQSSTVGYHWVYISGDSTTIVYQYNNGSTYTSVYWNDVLTTSTYMHLCFVADHSAQTVALYKNGTLVSSQSVTGIKPIAAAPAYVGVYQNSPNSSYDLKGRLPLYKMYEKALTASEVLQNFRAIKTRYGL